MLMYCVAVKLPSLQIKMHIVLKLSPFVFLISNAAFILAYSNHQVVQAQTKNIITSTNRNIQMQNLCIAGGQK